MTVKIVRGSGFIDLGASGITVAATAADSHGASLGLPTGNYTFSYKYVKVTHVFYIWEPSSCPSP